MSVRHRHRWFLSALVVVVSLAAGCGGDDGGGGEGAGAEIVIEAFAFGSPLVVDSGTVVQVVNRDGAGHTWTSVEQAFDSGFLNPGDTFEYRFEEPGEFGFFCAIHPSMTGSITVAS